MSKSKIEWTDETWNPVTGCTKVSQGCKNCYAEREWPRLTRLVPSYAGRDFTDVRTHEDRLDKPLHWKRPRRIFVNSMSDLFHPDVSDAFIDRVFAVMALAPHHVFQVLTKRPERMREYLTAGDLTERVIREAFRMDCEGGAWMNADHHIGGYKVMPLPNAWLGVSVEDQATADERIPLLLETPAAVRWISAEPLLGQVNAGLYLSRTNMPGLRLMPGFADPLPGIDWVVVGGESGPNARPMSIQWARLLRDQCAVAGVSFLFKQWGEWAPAMVRQSEIPGQFAFGDYAYEPDRFVLTDRYPRAFTSFGARAIVERVGKKRAGRLLDGVQHDGYPEAKQ